MFAYRSGLENGFGFYGNLQLDIREAVALLADGLSIAGYEKSEAGDVLFLHFGLDELVDGIGTLIGSSECRLRQGENNECKGKMLSG